MTTLGTAGAWQAYLAEDYTWFPFRSGVFAIVLATIAYPLRFWARRLQSAPWGWSDWLMIPSFISVVGMGICGILCASYGSGRHVEYVVMQPPQFLESWGVMNLYVSAFFYLPGVTFPKLSIFFIYLRIMESRWQRISCWVMMAMLVARLVVEFISIPLQCNQLQQAWQPSEWAGNCNNIWAHYTWGRLPNVISDVAMLILPLPTIWKLKLEFKLKVGLLGTFLLGGFGLATAILNMAAFIEEDVFGDITWASGALVAWSVLETSVYFNTACLITYRPLLTHFMRHTFSRSGSRMMRSRGGGALTPSGLEKSIPCSPDGSDNDKARLLDEWHHAVEAPADPVPTATHVPISMRRVSSALVPLTPMPATPAPVAMAPAALAPAAPIYPAVPASYRPPAAPRPPIAATTVPGVPRPALAIHPALAPSQLPAPITTVVASPSSILSAPTPRSVPLPTSRLFPAPHPYPTMRLPLPPRYPVPPRPVRPGLAQRSISHDVTMRPGRERQREKSLPPAPDRFSLQTMDRCKSPDITAWLTVPPPSYQAVEDHCGTCNKCVAVEISQHMKRAHTVEIV